MGYTVFMFDNISSPAARPLLCLSPILCTVLCFKGWIKSKKIWNPTFCMLRKFINAIHETSTIILLYYYYYVAHKFIHFLTNDDDILYTVRAERILSRWVTNFFLEILGELLENFSPNITKYSIKNWSYWNLGESRNSGSHQFRPHCI